MQAHTLGEVGILGTVLLRVSSETILSNFIEIGSYRQGAKNKLAQFFWETVYNYVQMFFFSQILFKSTKNVIIPDFFIIHSSALREALLCAPLPKNRLHVPTSFTTRVYSMACLLLLVLSCKCHNAGPLLCRYSIKGLTVRWPVWANMLLIPSHIIWSIDCRSESSGLTSCQVVFSATEIDLLPGIILRDVYEMDSDEV